jgi:DNA-binding response OmpR family regulator
MGSGRPAGTILVVEARHPLREVLSDALRWEGHRVLVCATEEQAVAQLGAGGVSLVILGWVTAPAAAGALSRAVRAHPGGAPLPVLSIDEHRSATGDGITETVRQPFRLETLLAALARHLGPRAHGGPGAP